MEKLMAELKITPGVSQDMNKQVSPQGKKTARFKSLFLLEVTLYSMSIDTKREIGIGRLVV